MLKVILSTVLLLTSVVVFTVVQAQENDIAAMLQQRHEDMKDNGNAMKQLGKIFKGATPYSRTEVIEYARIIVDRSGERTSGLFPDESLDVPGSHVRLEVARNRERFAQLFLEMNTNSKELVSLAQQGGDDPELLAAFARLGKTCSACHTEFRIKH